MGVYQYTAMDVDARIVHGRVLADTARQARDELRERGLMLHQVIAVANDAETAPRRRWLGGVREHQVVSFVRELSTLLGVGIPMAEALSTIAKQHRGTMGTVLLALQNRVAAGASLAQAMREQPHVFDELCLSIVEVGENAGNLDVALGRLADFRERTAQLKGRIVTALIYPVIVFTMAIAVSIFLMAYVVPKLLSGIIEAGHQVPLATQLVQAASGFLLNYWWLLLTVTGVLFLGLGACLRSTKGKRFWQRVQLSVPILGSVIRKQAIVRIAIVIATLIRSGIVLDRAIQIAQRTCSNLLLREALTKVEQAIHAGRDVSLALDDTKVFPATVVQVFAVGERSGQLEQVLDRLASDYDRQVATAAQRFTAVLEPLLIIFMVLMVGLIAFATVLPMLEASNVLG